MRLVLSPRFLSTSAVSALAVCVFAACGTTTAASSTAAGADTSGAADTTTGDAVSADVAAADVDQGPQPAAPKAYNGTCPDLTLGGKVTITSGGQKRTAYVSLPDDYSAPGNSLLFLWHGLGDSGSNFSAAFGAPGIAKQNNAVVITPDNCCVKGLSCCAQVNGWAFLDATGGADSQLFDDLLSCATQQMSIDTKRVYTAGFSAGALWTTWLILNRSEYLAAAAPFSGGVGLIDYITPFWKIPVLGSWGGDTDIFAGYITFYQYMQDFIADLRKNDDFVIACNHGLGHTVPPEGPDYAVDFLFRNTFGKTANPYGAGAALPSVFPSYCTIAP